MEKSLSLSDQTKNIYEEEKQKKVEYMTDYYLAHKRNNFMAL